MRDASSAPVRSFDAAVAYSTGRTQFGAKLLCSDAKVTQIYEGTNQVQGLLIAKAVYAGARAS